MYTKLIAQCLINTCSEVKSYCLPPYAFWLPELSLPSSVGFMSVAWGKHKFTYGEWLMRRLLILPQVNESTPSVGDGRSSWPWCYNHWTLPAPLVLTTRTLNGFSVWFSKKLVTIVWSWTHKKISYKVVSTLFRGCRSELSICESVPNTYTVTSWAMNLRLSPSTLWITRPLLWLLWYKYTDLPNNISGHGSHVLFFQLVIRIVVVISQEIVFIFVFKTTPELQQLA